MLSTFLYQEFSTQYSSVSIRESLFLSLVSLLCSPLSTFTKIAWLLLDFGAMWIIYLLALPTYLLTYHEAVLKHHSTLWARVWVVQRARSSIGARRRPTEHSRRPTSPASTRVTLSVTTYFTADPKSASSSASTTST